MFLTGFADEAGKAVETQIKATRALGWRNIELRAAGEKNLSTMSDAEFDEMHGLLKDAGVKINCFGSGIANWAKSPLDEKDFDASVKELKDALPRMKKLGTDIVRGMSFKILDVATFDSPELEKTIFGKVSQLVKICEDAGIIYGHENCMNYGGQSHVHTLRLLENIKSPAFKLIFDTGNPVFTFNRIGPRPHKLQDAFKFYRNVREFIYYVHIKDGVPEAPENDVDRPATKFTFAGEGNGKVREILTDLKKHGYDGGFSMEPHLETVFHENDDKADSELAAKRKFETYVEYGKRFEKLLKECGY